MYICTSKLKKIKMRNFCLILLLITIAPSLWFSSCAKVDEYGDSETIISDVVFNMDDTIYIEDLKMNIIINDSASIKPNNIDTLVIGKPVYIKARFQDEIGLSSFKVEMKIDSSKLTPTKDSLYYFYSLGADIFSSSRNKIYDITVRKNTLVTIPVTVTRLNKETNETESVDVYQGDYIIKVACLNLAGRGDTIYHKVKLLSRDSIRTIRGI